MCAVTRHIPKGCPPPSPSALKAKAAAELEEQLEETGKCKQVSVLAAGTQGGPSLLPPFQLRGLTALPAPSCNLESVEAEWLDKPHKTTEEKSLTQ